MSPTTTTQLTDTSRCHTGAVAVYRPPADLATKQPAVAARVVTLRPVTVSRDATPALRPVVKVAAAAGSTVTVCAATGFALGYALVGVQLLATVAGTAVLVALLLLAATTVLVGHGGGCCCPFHH